eukprot:CAMPEP_0172452554 /NCGR_PEP_ID=MMETSP1065-20121228/10175_1 /TAXON_ID=265537 /ORGANISM="Amphiprora paludosa, Strain CCMP125" /LENGTH=360 /DNA_ID=CAMNT_0013204625 /DNA_START=38 /DNA_END=1120 /DNA_ORIENTATION=+
MAAFYQTSLSLELTNATANASPYASPEYLAMNVSLVALVGAVWLALQHRLPPSQQGPTVGYSGVLFALSVIATLHQPPGMQTCPIPFFDQACFSTMRIGGVVPFSWSPLIQLVLAQVLLPRVSWTGHLAGVLVGFAYMWGWVPLLAFPSVYWPLLHMAFLGGVRKIETKLSLLQYQSAWFIVQAVTLVASILVAGGPFGGLTISFALLFLFDCFVETSERNESAVRGYIVTTILNLAALSITFGSRIGIWTDPKLTLVQGTQWTIALVGFLRHVPETPVGGIFDIVLGPILFPWTEMATCQGWRNNGEQADELMLPLSQQQSTPAMAFPGSGRSLGGGGNSNGMRRTASGDATRVSRLVT